MGKNSSAYEMYKKKQKKKKISSNRLQIVEKKKPTEKNKKKFLTNFKINQNQVSSTVKKQIKLSKRNEGNKLQKVYSDEKQMKLRKQQEEDKTLQFLYADDVEEEICINMTSPIEDGKKMFEWLIHPFKVDTFFNEKWEKEPLFLKRFDPHRYKHLMSTPLLDEIMRENYLLFSKNIDITSFVNDVRETHNPEGRALPSVVWDYYMNGCSVRFLNPQTFIPKIHTLNATLQEFFGCFVGANSYLTPPNSQGFAPHYDDIEAFILQIEGRKRWRVYKPAPKSELPRFSSPNFSQKDLGDPVLDVVVEAGDLLYFPRGYIHQGDTIDSEKHSLHVTVSAYQRNSWGDFLEKLIPATLNKAIESDKRFRQGLPLDYLQYTGFAYDSDKQEEQDKRQKLLGKTKALLSSMIDKYLDVDAAANEMAKKHMHDFLPPALNGDEVECSIYEGGERMMRMGKVVNRVEIEPDTQVRLTRAHCARLVEEENTFRLYYSCDNSKEYHEFEPQFLELDQDFVPALRNIISKYPEFVRVEDLPIDGLDKQIQIVQDLWEKGIVLSYQQLPIVAD